MNQHLSSDLNLLLAHFDDGRPALDRGLPLEAAGQALSPEPLEEVPSPHDRHLYDPGSDPNDLVLQRWGVIYPEGSRLLEAIHRLRSWRQAQMGGVEPPAFAVKPGMTAIDARAWIQQVFDPSFRSEREMPRYLLLLGDLDRVSLELQQVLSLRHFVGRLAFVALEGQDDLEAYEAYADKLIRFEDPQLTPPSPSCRAVGFTVQDGTAATTHGHEYLMKPAIDLARDQYDQEQIEVPLEGRGAALPSPAELMAVAREATPTVLMTLSHGLGAPRGGWTSPAEQRRAQGAMSFGPGQPPLTADDVRSGPFLPGGFWFYFACFGGATPSSSIYWHWLRGLWVASEIRQNPDLLQDTLSCDGRPFIAALPQAALRNPEGPLVVVGHADLAWSYSYQEAPGRPGHAQRFLRFPQHLARGKRAGVAFSDFMNELHQVNERLIGQYDADALTRHQALARIRAAALKAFLEARAAGQPDARFLYDDAEAERRLLAQLLPDRKRGHLWMMRQDLINYLLLGDPAARLPLLMKATARAGTPASSGEQPAAMAQSQGNGGMPATPEELKKRERAVLEWIRGEDGARKIASRAGTTLETLEEWVRVYREAGRRALSAWQDSEPE